MKTLIKLTLLPLLFMLSMSAIAQDGGRVAVVDIQEAILKTDLAKSRLSELQAQEDFSANVKKIEGMKKEYDEMVAKLQKDRAVMNNQQLQTEMKKIQEKRADMEFTMKKLQSAEADLLKSLSQEIGPKIQLIMVEIIKTENIGLLLDRKAALHVGSNFNITALLTDKLNQSK